MWKVFEKQPGSRLGLLAQASQPSQVDLILENFRKSLFRFYSCATPTPLKKTSITLTDTRALSIISSTFIELVRSLDFYSTSVILDLYLSKVLIRLLTLAL